MNSIWLCNLEKQILISKSEQGKKVKKVKVADSANPPEEIVCSAEEKNRRNEEHFLNWKRKKIMEKKCEQVEEPIVEKEDIKHSSEQIDANFEEWMRVKRQMKVEQKKAQMQAKIDYDKRLDELVQKRATKRGDKKKIKLVSRPRAKLTRLPVQQKAPRSIPCTLAEQLDALSWDTKSHGVPLENELDSMHSLGHRLRGSKTSRLEARIQHQSQSYRADTLQQLRSWKQATGEIHNLACILHKIVYYELNLNGIVLLDPWRWLPWKIVRNVFHESLISILESLDIANMKSTSIALLYVYCHQQNARFVNVKKRSEVATALCTWIFSIAAVHHLVEQTSFKLLPIDHLSQAGVCPKDIANAFLITEVYPNTNSKHQNELHTSRKKLQTKLNPYENDVITTYKLFNPQHQNQESSVISIVSALRRRTSNFTSSNKT